jgi:hypothetical protein
VARGLPLLWDMTTSSQTLTRTLPGLVHPDTTGDTSLGARAASALAALRCKLQGHAPALCIDDRRVYLACPDCGVKSPGWQLDHKAPRPRFAGAPDRFARYAWVTGRRQA